MLKRFVICLVSCVIGLVSGAFAAEESTATALGFSQTKAPTGFIKGINWGWVGARGEYTGQAPADSMKKLAETGSSWICISFAGEMTGPSDTNIVFGEADPCMVTDAEIRHAIDLARQNKLKIILKPVVNCKDGTWRGFIDFKVPDGSRSDIEQWNKWFASFKMFLEHYAKIAEETKCDMLCLGCEMGTSERFITQWRGLIADIRKVYTGPITYNANHGNEEKVAWWDAVDIIGMSGYYPIGADMNKPNDDPCKVPNDSSVEGMKKRWGPIKQKLKYVSKKFDRPVFFIEIGVCSVKGNTSFPWLHPYNNAIYDGNEQARFYQAAMESFWDEPWFFGFVWWDWPANLYPVDKGAADTGFCIYGKPAEKLIREWYNKPR